MKSATIFQILTAALVFSTTSALGQTSQLSEDELGIGNADLTARELNKQIEQQPPSTDDKQLLSIFYHKRGVANYKIGRYEAAISDLNIAINNNQSNRLAPDNWGDMWRMQNDLGNALSAKGNWSETIPYFENLANKYKNNLYTYHYLQLRLADFYTNLGQWEKVEKTLDTANTVILQLRARPDWYYNRWNAEFHQADQTANALSSRGNLVEAERFRRLQLDFAQRDIEFKKTRFRTGDARIGSSVGNLSNAKLALSNILTTRGKHGEAQLLARAALEDRLGNFGFNSQPVAGALATLGYATSEVGDFKLAEKYYRLALNAQEQSGASPFSTVIANRRNNLGYILELQRRWAEANQIFEERYQALQKNREQTKGYGPNTLNWALSLYKTGQFQRSETMAGRILTNQLARPKPNLFTVAIARGTLALSQTSVGKLEEAKKSFQLAIPELLKRDSDDDSGSGTVSKTFWIGNILEGYLELLGKLKSTSDSPTDTDLGDESFRMADIARGSSVQTAIAASAARAQLPNAALAELARRAQDALNRIGSLNLLIGRLASAPEAERLNKVIEDMQRDIEGLRKERTVLQGKIIEGFPEYAALLDPKPVGIADTRKAMSKGDALVSIYIGENEAYVWTLGLNNKNSYRVVPITRREIETDVANLRRSFDFGAGSIDSLPAFNLAISHKLYKALLAPDEALWEGAATLNVIPHGALGQIPFSVLVTSEATERALGAQASYTDVPWLARKVAVTQLPSANAFIALRRSPPPKAGRDSFIGFGNPQFAAASAATANPGPLRNLSVKKPVGDRDAQIQTATRGREKSTEPDMTLADVFEMLGALPDTENELKEIASALKSDITKSLFLGGRASEHNVKTTHLDNHAVVAFATHGLIPGEVPGLDQPSLVLSNPKITGEKDEDGFLTLEEVLGLKLDADWVVLSACNTASADGRGGEAVSGLGRAFFYAGARSLLVSNWAVETVSASRLTTELFRRQTEDQNISRAEALRQAMLAVMKTNSPEGYSYAHPLFWAPFSLVGDGGR